MKFKAGHRYLVRFISTTAQTGGVTEVKCIEVSPTGCVKLRLSNGDEVWYAPEDQNRIMVVDDLGGPLLSWRNRIVNE